MINLYQAAQLISNILRTIYTTYYTLPRTSPGGPTAHPPSPHNGQKATKVHNSRCVGTEFLYRVR